MPFSLNYVKDKPQAIISSYRRTLYVILRRNERFVSKRGFMHAQWSAHAQWKVPGDKNLIF